MHFRAWRAHQMRKPALPVPLLTPWTKTGQNLAEGGCLVYKPIWNRRVKRKSRLEPRLRIKKTLIQSIVEYQSIQASRESFDLAWAASLAPIAEKRDARLSRLLLATDLLNQNIGPEDRMNHSMCWAAPQPHQWAEYVSC